MATGGGEQTAAEIFAHLLLHSNVHHTRPRAQYFVIRKREVEVLLMYSSRNSAWAGRLCSAKQPLEARQCFSAWTSSASSDVNIFLKFGKFLHLLQILRWDGNQQIQHNDKTRENISGMALWLLIPNTYINLTNTNRLYKCKKTNCKNTKIAKYRPCYVAGRLVAGLPWWTIQVWWIPLHPVLSPNYLLLKYFPPLDKNISSRSLEDPGFQMSC